MLIIAISSWCPLSFILLSFFMYISWIWYSYLSVKKYNSISVFFRKTWLFFYKVLLVFCGESWIEENSASEFYILNYTFYQLNFCFEVFVILELSSKSSLGSGVRIFRGDFESFLRILRLTITLKKILIDLLMTVLVFQNELRTVSGSQKISSWCGITMWTYNILNFTLLLRKISN